MELTKFKNSDVNASRTDNALRLIPIDRLLSSKHSETTNTIPKVGQKKGQESKISLASYSIGNIKTSSTKMSTKSNKTKFKNPQCSSSMNDTDSNKALNPSEDHNISQYLSTDSNIIDTGCQITELNVTNNSFCEENPTLVGSNKICTSGTHEHEENFSFMSMSQVQNSQIDLSSFVRHDPLALTQDLSESQIYVQECNHENSGANTMPKITLISPAASLIDISHSKKKSSFSKGRKKILANQSIPKTETINKGESRESAQNDFNNDPEEHNVTLSISDNSQTSTVSNTSTVIFNNTAVEEIIIKTQHETVLLKDIQRMDVSEEMIQSNTSAPVIENTKVDFLEDTQELTQNNSTIIIGKEPCDYFQNDTNIDDLVVMELPYTPANSKEQFHNIGDIQTETLNIFPKQLLYGESDDTFIIEFSEDDNSQNEMEYTTFLRERSTGPLLQNISFLPHESKNLYSNKGVVFVENKVGNVKSKDSLNTSKCQKITSDDSLNINRSDNVIYLSMSQLEHTPNMSKLPNTDPLFVSQDFYSLDTTTCSNSSSKQSEYVTCSSQNSVPVSPIKKEQRTAPGMGVEDQGMHTDRSNNSTEQEMHGKVISNLVEQMQIDTYAKDQDAIDANQNLNLGIDHPNEEVDVYRESVPLSEASIPICSKPAENVFETAVQVEKQNQLIESNTDQSIIKSTVTDDSIKTVNDQIVITERASLRAADNNECDDVSPAEIQNEEKFLDDNVFDDNSEFEDSLCEEEDTQENNKETEPWWIRKDLNQPLDPDFEDFINFTPHLRVQSTASTSSTSSTVISYRKKYSPFFLILADLPLLFRYRHDDIPPRELWYQLYGERFHNIMFYGRVVSVNNFKEHVHVYTVDDGTGSVQVRFNHSSPSIMKNLKTVEKLTYELALAREHGLPNMMPDSSTGPKANKCITLMEHLLKLANQRALQPTKQLGLGSRVFVIGAPYFYNRDKIWSVRAFALEEDDTEGVNELFWKKFIVRMYEEVYFLKTIQGQNIPAVIIGTTKPWEKAQCTD